MNYEGAPEFWGRDVGSVQKNIEHWNVDYVVVYQNAGTELDAKWQDAGFKVLGDFSWKEYEEDLSGSRPYKGPTPTWWLLKKPTATIQAQVEIVAKATC